VQLAKHYGAHVTAVCGTGNIDLVKSLGADVAIDYTAHDFTRDGQTYDVICDVLGKSGFPGSLRALEPRSRYLLVGFSGGLLAIAAALMRGFWAHARGRAVLMTGPAVPVQSDLEFLKTGWIWRVAT
jgi:NADPH2:quinone reductase